MAHQKLLLSCWICLLLVSTREFQIYDHGLEGLSAWIQLISLLACEMLLLTVVYRLGFHPLREYPGPCLAAVTDYYVIYHCLLQDNHLNTYKLHQRYGNIVRYGPNRISYNTKTALREIYAVQANCQKGSLYNTFRHFFKVPASMTTINRRKHAFKRRINVQAFGGKAIPLLQPVILDNIRLFCSQLVAGNNEEWGTAHDISKLSRCLTFDIMSDVTFGENLGMLKSTEQHWLLDMLPKGVAGINMSGYAPWFLKLRLDRVLFRQLTRDTYRFEALSATRAARRISRQVSDTKNAPYDLFAALMEAEDPTTGLGYSRQDLIAEAGLLIIAGSDTTAAALSAVIHYLLHVPETLTKLQTEVHREFSDIEAIRDGERLNKCVYLRACIDEALRMSPGVGAVLPREVLPGGMVIEGKYFPAGIDVGVSAYSLQHDETAYPQPFLFSPERWLHEAHVGTATSKLDAKELGAAFCAFGVGRTSCIGKTLAYMELSLILARIVFSYDMRLVPTDDDGTQLDSEEPSSTKEFRLYDHFTSSHFGPMVQFRQRDQDSL